MTKSTLCDQLMSPAILSDLRLLIAFFRQTEFAFSFRSRLIGEPLDGLAVGTLCSAVVGRNRETANSPELCEA